MQTAQPLSGTPTSSANRLAAWLVHLYTASGAVAAFLGTLAVVGSRYREAFLWMVFATFVDATDGLFARAADVKRVLPGFDGAKLDDIIDYLTWVFLPVLLLLHAGALPPGWGVAVACVVLLSSAYGFASLDAKTNDHFFTGFPSYWNIVALYLYAMALPPFVNAIILLVLSVLVFVRTGYVYPSRMPVLRTLTVVLGAVWGVMVITVIVMLPSVSRPLLFGSLFFPVYYVALSFALQARRVREPLRT